MNITLDVIRRIFKDYQRKSNHHEKVVHAGVLMLLFERRDNLHIVLTKRTEDVEHHKGQISFPGGSMDEKDVSIIDTALRETEEEIGIKRGDVEIIGMLDDFYSITGFCITPIIGALFYSPTYLINEREVAEVFDLPLSFFIQAYKLNPELYRIEGQDGKRLSYIYNQYEIWGITAKILTSFIEKIVNID